MRLHRRNTFDHIRTAVIAATLAQQGADWHRRQALPRRLDRALVACEEANLAGADQVPAVVQDLIVEVQVQLGEEIAPPATIAAALDEIERLSEVGE